MSTKDDGGPAFACASNHGYQGGMSLRDWFAGMALSDNLARLTPGSIDQSFAQYLAEQAYLVADAMLAERKKRDE